MYNVYDFIRWALTHADRSGLLKSGNYPIPSEQIGSEPWHYLFGSVRVQTNKDTLDRYYNQHYCESMTRAQYDAITADWKPTDYATDCQGLLDAWLTYEAGEKTDKYADYNYRYWCENKGRIAEIDRPYVVGEAVFKANDAGKMTHVGWVCGFDAQGRPLVVEARSIAYGVVVTKLNSRPWTHRGLMTKKFDYTEKEDKPMERVIFENVSPMHRGEAYLKMQQALNAAGYTDAEGKKLDEDGKWGKCSQAAFDSLIADYAKVPETPMVMEFTSTSADGAYILKSTVAKLKGARA